MAVLSLVRVVLFNQDNEYLKNVAINPKRHPLRPLQADLVRTAVCFIPEGADSRRKLRLCLNKFNKP